LVKFATGNNNKMQIQLGPIGQIMRDKLTAAFNPSTLELIDESNQHHGHAGAHPSGESHFRVRIAADAFNGQSRVAQHRLINAALAAELKQRVHALAIEVHA
jgi:BolA family transcriptional regulator, general stress-responsive regulator